MSKRTSRQSNKLSEKSLTKEIVDEEEIPQENITKKCFNSTNTATISNTSTVKESVKQTKKMILSELKNLKNLRKKQEVILMNIEKENIQKHVSNLLEKFDPPQCINCPNRRADRICINKACGLGKYNTIICGKCHFKEHQSAIIKPEIDVEEYFIKLSTFMNETNYADSNASKQPRIDIDNLETVFDHLDELRSKLASLKSQIENEIESYASPMEMQSLLQNSITKALSLCEYDNIQEQLLNVKKSVLFEKNKFLWNDVSEKSKIYAKNLKKLDDTILETGKQISKSFIGGMQINLDGLVVKDGYNATVNAPREEFKGKDDEIKIAVSSGNGDRMFYLDYNLQPDRKYKLRFRFEHALRSYIMVGVMQKSKCQNTWLSQVPNQNFLKRFLCSSPTQECSRILKGGDLSISPQQGQQIEIRVDFEKDYVDFYDFPEMKNVNANHETEKFIKGEEYVFIFLIYDPQTVVIESMSEISFLEEIL